jgi:hypothetical protein
MMPSLHISGFTFGHISGGQVVLSLLFFLFIVTYYYIALPFEELFVYRLWAKLMLKNFVCIRTFLFLNEKFIL